MGPYIAVGWCRNKVSFIPRIHAVAASAYYLWAIILVITPILLLGGSLKIMNLQHDYQVHFYTERLNGSTISMAL
jgi:hypothetical protein